MVKINYIDNNGDLIEANLDIGESLMDGALRYDVSGIDADCGGSCSCATCHIYIPDDFAEKISSMSKLEENTLLYAENKTANSRLACQVKVSKELHGVTIKVASGSM
ncbi:2Fe-2S iron-sulfur cluster-binding protein [Providencia rettgeri]|uniref:2Fe-2S iron-sulfur cluster-binding protein n=1 Tax=Providencia rettgeri TaxID=587 RepID=UPI0032DB95F3